MNSTKRKFNALLQGIGNKSSTSLPNKEALNPAEVDSQLKKRRVVPSLSSSVTKTTHSSHQKSASIATPALPEDAPKYAPWDRTAFLKRLKSFSNLTDWTPKPAKVNEVEWAKRGWVCQKTERVRCCLCNVEIVVKLNRKEVEGKEEPVYIAGNIEDSLVERYMELIITSHDEDCLWRKRGCDDSIFKLPLSHTPTTLQDLRTRYDELCSRKGNLPYLFNLRLPTDFDYDTILSHLPADFFALFSTETTAPEISRQSINKVAFQMSLFGWQGHKHERLGNQPGSVSCHACFRVLGLWLFKSKSVNESEEEIEGAPINCLDLISEHREYCPWRNPVSQNGPKATKASTSGMAGWEVVLRMLKNDYHLRHAGERHKERPRKPSIDVEDGEGGEFGADSENEDARSVREEDDKKRWARLRRVKSLFDTKKSKRLSVTESKGNPAS